MVEIGVGSAFSVIYPVDRVVAAAPHVSNGARVKLVDAAPFAVLANDAALLFQFQFGK